MTTSIAKIIRRGLRCGFVCLASVICFCASAFAEGSLHPAKKTQKQPAKTGMTTRDFFDNKRSNWLGTGPRPLSSLIWYPAGEGGESQVIQDAVQFSTQVTVFKDAAIEGRKKYPLIIISHGSQGNAMQMRWLGYYLASHGYIAVALNHSGPPDVEHRIGTFSLSDFCLPEHPQDISAVLTAMLNDGFFSGHIDASRIGVAGFSLGGASAIWVSGGILNLEELARKTPPPPEQLRKAIDSFKRLQKTNEFVRNSFLHAGDSFKDHRIKAVFALAPAIGEGFDKDGLKNIDVPVQIVVGDADLIAPKEQNAEAYTKNILTARKLIVLPGERGHYIKPPLANERPGELLEVSEIARKFFDDTLK